MTGGTIMEIRFCMKCGASLKPGAKFCAKCGVATVNGTDIRTTELNGQTIQTPEQEPAAAMPVQYGGPQVYVVPAVEEKGNKKKRRVLLSVILAAIIVTLVIPGTIALVVRKQVKKHNGQAPAAFAQAAEEDEDRREEKETTAVDAYFPIGDYSGEVDDEGEDSDGLELPIAGPGEKVYIGYGDLKGIGMTKMALVLSEDGQSVHDIVILLNDISKTLGGYNVMFANMQTSMPTEFDLPVKDGSLGESTVKDMHMEGDYIYVKLDYVFMNISFGTGNDQTIPLGETEIWMKEAGK